MEYYRNKCIECKTNTKKLWNVINTIIGKTNKKSHTIDSIKVDNILKYTPGEIDRKWSEEIEADFAKW